MTTITAVIKCPRSTGEDEDSNELVEKSSPPQCANNAFGKGASRKVKAEDEAVLKKSR